MVKRSWMQLNTGHIGGLDVQAGEIIDIIDGYKGQGYGKSTEEELGWCWLK